MRFYGFLSNAYTAALVSPDGSLDWLPLPRFDSPAVFARLLDRERGGHFSISPAGGAFTSRQRYVEGTNCLVTEHATARGRARVIDYLAVGRPEVRRLVRAEVPLRVHVQPVFGYGLTAAAYRRRPDGADFTNPAGREGLLLRICGPATFGPEDSRTRWLLEPGEYELILRYVQDFEAEGEAALCAAGPSGALFRQQRRYWRSATQTGYEGPFGRLVRRSLLVIRGLTYRTTGAIIAAPTTSLPEVLGGDRQWDYRFHWIRDGSYAAEALLAAGDEVDAALLLLPLYGFLAPDDPAFVRTLEAIERELVEGPFVYRYREDDLGRAAHPFLLASCWLARVYLRQGRRAEAGEVLEGVSRVATDLGLFGEHVDQETGEPRGNFPHLFSHAGFLLAALELAAGVGPSGGAAPGPGAGGA